MGSHSESRRSLEPMTAPAPLLPRALLSKWVLNTTQSKTFSYPLTNHLSMNQIKTSPQRLVLSQCFLKPFIPNLKYIGKCCVGKSKSEGYFESNNMPCSDIFSMVPSIFPYSSSE